MTRLPGDPWYCPRCQRQFDTDPLMMDHIKRNHPELYKQILDDEVPVRQ